MKLARSLALWGLCLGCSVDEPASDDEVTSAPTTEPMAMVSPYYRACPSLSDAECEEPTPACFADLRICVRSCTEVEDCPEAPPEGSATPVCAQMEFHSQTFQICALSCGVDADCPPGQACASVVQCSECPTPICQAI